MQKFNVGFFHEDLSLLISHDLKGKKGPHRQTKQYKVAYKVKSSKSLQSRFPDITRKLCFSVGEKKMTLLNNLIVFEN